MTSIDNLENRFQEAGASVICRHDFKRDGLALSAVIPASAIAGLARSLREEGLTLLDI